MLSPGQISAFLADGYVALPGAVPAGLARACQDVVWSELGQRGVRRDDPATWTAPVVRIAARKAARSPRRAPGRPCRRRATS